LLSTIAYRINKLKLKHSDSSPYLSGDLFKHNSELQVTEKWLRGSNKRKLEISSARVIFCESNLLAEFLENYGDKVEAKVLICGNSDFDFNSAPDNIPKSVRLCLFQNLSFQSDFFKVLPIGLENLSLATNGFTKYYSAVDYSSPRLSKVLAGPFSPTHPERQQLIDEISGNIYFDVITMRLEPPEYQSTLGKYRYVLCPRGNGIDTHRFWETLYKGNLPVVTESTWSAHIRKLGIPFLHLSEVGTAIKANEIDTSIPFIAENIETLWWPYWRALINSHL
jgi:hypothetical protein